MMGKFMELKGMGDDTITEAQVQQLGNVLYTRSLRYFSKTNLLGYPLAGDMARYPREKYAQVARTIAALVKMLPEKDKSNGTHSLKIWMAIIMGEETEKILRDLDVDLSKGLHDQGGIYE